MIRAAVLIDNKILDTVTIESSDGEIGTSDSRGSGHDIEVCYDTGTRI